MNDYPVRTGSMLFTLVDPRRGREVAYNRWYERDHLYAGCMVGPWLFAGRRWVAPKRLKQLRFPGDSPVAVPVESGSYLSIYWVHEGHHRDHFDWAMRQVVELYSEGRGFDERVHAHTALLNRPSAIYRDADPVPIELALDHPYRGLVVAAVDPVGDTTVAEIEGHLRESALPALMKDSPVASMVSWRYIDTGGGEAGAPMDLGTPSGPPDRRLQLFFVEDDPETAWDRFRSYPAALEGVASVVFTAPFVPTLVGTDKYTDELW